MALAAVLLTLVVVNVWVHVGPRRAQLATGPLAAAFLLGVGRAAGLSWEQLGLGSGSLARGALWGGVCAAAVVVGFAVVLAVRPAHRFFQDVRYRLGIRSALATAFLVVPVGTVLFEEVAFRGVLWALLEDAKGPVGATALTSLLFGAWHILPAVDLARTNTTLAGSGGRAKLVATVLGTVAFTAAAGVVFAALRRHSGSLLAPVLLHWATNAAGVLGSAIVWGISRARSRPAG
ncbi:MAG: CPBP family intramembrane glutamic endopeptidase [Mycobacteriales bacterium]